MLTRINLALMVCLMSANGPACAADEILITSAQEQRGAQVPYILNVTPARSPRYVVILFPGGSGQVNPRIEEGQLVYGFKGNFVLRAREFLVDDEFATVTTNSTESESRIQAVLDDLKRRYPDAQLYLMGTSRGTASTMALAAYLSDKIAGVIHTSSLNKIYGLDAHRYRNRQLIVHHKDDSCHATPFRSALYAHEHHGTDLIAMEGGTVIGPECEPFSHHGFHGIERETVNAIKAWIRQGG